MGCQVVTLMLCAGVRLLTTVRLTARCPAQTAWSLARHFAARDGGRKPPLHDAQSSERIATYDFKKLSSSPLGARITALSHKGKWEAAVKAFQDAEAKHHKSTVSENRALLFALARNGNTAEAWAAVHRLRGMGALTVFDYEYALQAHEKSRHWSGALRLLSHMDKKNIKWTARACSHALLTCGFAGRLNAALQLLEERCARGLSPDPDGYLQLIGECVRNSSSKKVRDAGDSRGGSKQAVAMLQHMKQTGAKPDIRHFTAVVDACGKAGDWIDALDVFQQMRLEGIQPDVRTWSALLDAIGNAGQLEKMLATYKEMCATGEQPDVIAMTTMLDHAGAAGEVDIVNDIWRELHERQLVPNVRSYNTRINCYATVKDPGKAEEVLAEMIQSAGITPDAISFSSLMKAYVRSGRLDEAVLVIARMRAARVQPTVDTWISIIHAAEAYGDVKKADELYADALSSGTIRPYKPSQSTVIKLASGKNATTGCIMDLHELNAATGRAAVRHELQLRQDCAARRQTPLHIITGQGDGQLQRAVCETLRSQGIASVYAKGNPGVIYVHPTRLGVTAGGPKASA
eukprot:TRINITY_DN943_c0_g3_i1.p1 TRINITY_DN943_c0_g3~~TRINITY_DN943_c0_g3_i1.p1  ORF type:complete len:575 (+),score=62.25 TRINITY_DN943_c0_g3_i1:179-1903(+)